VGGRASKCLVTAVRRSPPSAGCCTWAMATRLRASNGYFREPRNIMTAWEKETCTAATKIQAIYRGHKTRDVEVAAGRMKKGQSTAWSAGWSPRVISDCHFRKAATDYDRKPGIKWLSCTRRSTTIGSIITLSAPPRPKRRGLTVGLGRIVAFKVYFKVYRSSPSHQRTLLTVPARVRKMPSWPRS
jgi:hypothetical protein